MLAVFVVKETLNIGFSLNGSNPKKLTLMGIYKPKIGLNWSKTGQFEFKYQLKV